MKTGSIGEIKSVPDGRNGQADENGMGKNFVFGNMTTVIENNGVYISYLSRITESWGSAGP